MTSLDEICGLASAAFTARCLDDSRRRHDLLQAIAAGLERGADQLMAAARAETALDPARLTGELRRSVNQMLMFADLVQEGSWVDARIDPGPPDLRRMLVPLGPVAVFGASNFPFAFSVPGGDTASALAAGCPVIAKSHPAHPRTSRIAADIISSAADQVDLPTGVFALLEGGVDIGAALVQHDAVAAVAFTGSFHAGTAIAALAAERTVPIPVYAEMGSVNPVFVLPGACRTRGDVICSRLAESVTLGVGQFCTNPGVVLGLDRPRVNLLTAKVLDTPPAPMLTTSIGTSYEAALNELRGLDDVEVVGDVRAGSPVVVHASHGAFERYLELRREIFGPATVVVSDVDRDGLFDIARNLDGQLTATIFGGPGDDDDLAVLADIFRDRVGRIVIDGPPTGVMVSPAMHHGGPFPASTSVRDTSVGTASIARFARPICFQNAPASILPAPLRNENPNGLLRTIGTEQTRKPC